MIDHLREVIDLRSVDDDQLREVIDLWSVIDDLRALLNDQRGEVND